MLVDLTDKDITGRDAENALHAAGITVNKNMVPFDKRSPFVTSGIRLGTAAMTTRGFKESEMKATAQMMDRVLKAPDQADVQAKVKAEIREMCLRFPMYDFAREA